MKTKTIKLEDLLKNYSEDEIHISYLSMIDNEEDVRFCPVHNWVYQYSDGLLHCPVVNCPNYDDEISIKIVDYLKKERENN
jgi:nitrite reductase/ring-hydroxylating ferredoxin subunit